MIISYIVQHQKIPDAHANAQKTLINQSTSIMNKDCQSILDRTEVKKFFTMECSASKHTIPSTALPSDAHAQLQYPHHHHPQQIFSSLVMFVLAVYTMYNSYLA